MSTATILPMPSYAESRTVVPAPASGEGNWTGAPSAAFADGEIWLAYRVRRPLQEGRGIGVTLARSLDGETVEPVGLVDRDSFGAASLERPAIVQRPDGGWRLYVSCSEPGTKHWWIEALDADTVADLPRGRRTVVMPGDPRQLAVKDPVVVVDAAGWHMWVCCHPLTEPGHEDRMTSRYAFSEDGLTWNLGPVVLAPRAGQWDARGARITAITGVDREIAFYDGRATAGQNWYEKTGIATRGEDGAFHAEGEQPTAVSPHGQGALRYLSVVPLPDGRQRLYFEATRPDGAHDLRTQLI